MTGLPARSLIAAALALLAGAAIAVVAAAHISRGPTSLAATMAPSEGYVYGRVSSPARGCEDRRKVKLFRKLASGDELVGASRAVYNVTTANGPYTITSETTTFAPGKYYSRAAKVDLAPGAAHDHLCQPARSAGVTAGP